MSPFGLTSLKADQPVMSAFHDEGGSFESALCRLYTWYYQRISVGRSPSSLARDTIRVANVAKNGVKHSTLGYS